MKAKKKKSRKRPEATVSLSIVEAMLDRAVAAALAGQIQTSPTSVRYGKEPKAAPAKAKAAVLAELPKVTGWEKAFLASCHRAGGVTAKQAPTMARINQKLKALGEPEINLPARKKGDPTPGQKRQAAEAPAAKSKPALGRGFADIELTRQVAEAIRGAARGLTMGGIYDILASGEAALNPNGVAQAVEHLKAIGAIRERERNGTKLYLVA